MLKTKIKNYLNNNKIVKRIAMGLLLGAGGAVISKAILTIFNMVLARILSVEDYGIYSLMNNTVQTFTIFAGAGLGVTLTRYVALYREKNKDIAGTVICVLMIFNILISLFVSVLVYIFADKISILLNSNMDVTSFLKITSTTIFFTAIVSMLQGILQGFENYKSIAIIQIVSNCISFLVGIIISKIFGILGAIYSLLGLQIIIFICMFIKLFTILKNRKIKLKMSFNAIIKESILKVAIPSLLATIFVIPIMWITNFYFSSNIGLEEFAVFSVCIQWFNIVNYIPQQFGQLKPIYTQLYDGNKFKEMKRYINRIIIVTITFSTICATVFIIFKGLILRGYGEFYQSYSYSFSIMMIATILFAIQSQYGSVFQAIGKSWLCFALNVIWAISYLISFFILYRIGIVGYAYTYLISYTVYAIISTLAFYIIMRKGIYYDKENNYKDICEYH